MTKNERRQLMQLTNDPKWEEMVRTSMEAHIRALGPNVLSMPSDLIAQRAVGVAALTILHSDHPENLFPTDSQPEMNEPDGVQEGEVAVAVAQAIPALPRCSLCNGVGHERTDCPHDGLPGHGAG